MAAGRPDAVNAPTKVHSLHSLLKLPSFAKRNRAQITYKKSDFNTLNRATPSRAGFPVSEGPCGEPWQRRKPSGGATEAALRPREEDESTLLGGRGFQSSEARRVNKAKTTKSLADPGELGPFFLLISIGRNFCGVHRQHVVPVVRGRELGGARGAVYGSNKSPRRPHLVTTGVRKWAPAAWVSKSFTESHCVTRN
ncbi:hypothetical protein B296_00000543 [Ensete ventricosum]|uniref:Uncharacterized protein n=1 Tax=Ensete ventricosum TaxID=4639 RepID=A0A427AH03_ENSVE|nr:hypothetical protein B296_00000543 [Ensete ventricosum]